MNIERSDFIVKLAGRHVKLSLEILKKKESKFFFHFLDLLKKN